MEKIIEEIDKELGNVDKELLNLSKKKDMDFICLFYNKKTAKYNHRITSLDTIQHTIDMINGTLQEAGIPWTFEASIKDN